MKFGEVPVGEAVGATLVHTLRHGKLVLKKGRVLSADDVAALEDLSVSHVTVVRLDPGDLIEDDAAARMAVAVAGDNLEISAPFTGRVNLFAKTAGLVTLDRDRIDRINRVDEALTIATLPAYHKVDKGDMVATIKVIPFAAANTAIDVVETVALEGNAILSLAPFHRRRTCLIQTRLPGTAEKMLDKTVTVTRDRLEHLGSTIDHEERCTHAVAPLAEMLKTARAQTDLILVAGASAIADRRDVIPAAIEAAGGVVEHFGMPVDPGNLLLLGRLGDVPVLGLPGCARSPKLNGYDWVLERLMANIPVGRSDIQAMGVGGLLKEIPVRGQPRAGAAVMAPARAPKIAGIVLAAGQSRRMGPTNKLLEIVDGQPMVVHAVDAALASKLSPIIVVTGHEPDELEQVLGDRDVLYAHNPDYPEGLSTSLATGLRQVPIKHDGAMILLGDMPRIAPAHIDRLIAAFDPVEGRAIVVPTVAGKRGNPVLFDRRYFEPMAQVRGDTGARHLIGENEPMVVEIPMTDDATVLDIDTPEALARVRQA